MYTRSSIIYSRLFKIGLYIDKKKQMTNNIVMIEKERAVWFYQKK